jgi:hypothetical protein
MLRPKRNLDKAAMVWATSMASTRLEEYLKHAKKLTEDPDAANRKLQSQCPLCHYGSRIGGAACTSVPCSGCAKPMHFGSTNTDVLCLDCAKPNNLCRHCGGDIDMNPRRRKWPDFYRETEE